MSEQKKNFKDFPIDKNWTLFLDRDGVVSKKLENDYIKNWDEFEFLPNVLKAGMTLDEKFGKIVVVTNQRGVAKKLMKIPDLYLVNWQMVNEISKTGGRIDSVYFCPHNIEDNCDCRKPKTGMALKAKKDFPEINFQKSIMVGDSVIDMEFGKQLGMTTVLISDKKNIDKQSLRLADFVFESLFEFANRL